MPTERAVLVPGISGVVEELARARKKFPTWPTDPVHALAVLTEEVGELAQAVLDRSYKWGGGAPDQGRVEEEAAQVAAMAIRFYQSLDRYEYRESERVVDA